MTNSTFHLHNTIYIGMDVHKESFTLCCYTLEDKQCWGGTKIDANFNLVLKYVQRAKEFYDLNAKVVCGYEAGCLGYSLQRFLTKHGIECIILAPSTMETAPKARKLKTDKRDAEVIARCLAMDSYKPVFIPTEQDEEIKRFVRMREDHQKLAKSLKQEINAFCLSHGYRFTAGKNHWTQKHMDWLQELQLSKIDRETLDTYLLSLGHLNETLNRLDKRIEEFAQMDAYREKVQRLCCFIGVKVYTALAIAVEIGDFERFANAKHFASYVGLVPGEHSSDKSITRLGITKAGNAHVRRLLVESAQHYSRGKTGQKSADLKKRQALCSPKDVAYADRCNERLREKSSRMRWTNKNYNVSKTAIARELACFMWGMVTEHHERGGAATITKEANNVKAATLAFRGRPLSLCPKKEVSPEPPSRKKGRGAAKRKQPNDKT